MSDTRGIDRGDYDFDGRRGDGEDLTKKIDNFFDVVDNALSGADRVLNRSKYAEDKLKTHRAEADVKDAKPQAKSSQASTSTAIATRRFRIIEAVDAQSGETIFVVTDGGNARAECTTRELAEKILRAVEAAP